MNADEDKIGSAFDAFGRQVAGAFETIGEESALQIAEMVGVPVGYTTGPRGGTKVIRSKPHEAPRKETGVYFGSFAHAVAAGTGDVEMVLFTNDPKGVYLQLGTSRMIQRNHFDRILNYWEATFETRVAALVQQNTQSN